MTKVDVRPAPTAAARPKTTFGPRELPSPAPKLVKMGNLTATLVAQTDDMIRYQALINGKPVFLDVIEKYNPATALPLTEGLLKGRKSVLLADRDGVLNKARAFLDTPSDVTADAMIPEALGGAKALNEANVGLVVATNQGGYQAGRMSFEDMLAVNALVAQRIADAGGRVDAILICPFAVALKSPGSGDVDARKPAPGMPMHALQLAASSGVTVAGMVGDQRTDGAAAQGAGLEFFAITETVNGRWAAEAQAAQRDNETLPSLDPARMVEVSSLAGAANQVLAKLRSTEVSAYQAAAARPVVQLDP